MELKKQVISFELAKRLNNLFVKQDSIFYWIEDHRMQPRKDFTWKARLCPASQVNHILSSNVYRYAAFTVAELGEMLPFSVEIKGEEVTCEDYKNEKGWDAWFANAQCHMVGSKFTANTEAEARGLMLVYLIENKLITP